MINQIPRNGPGFEITYEAKECGTYANAIDGVCGSVCREYSVSSGLITSPYHPVPYTDGAECIIKISQPNGSYINMTFPQYDTYKNDILEIRDGSTEGSALIGKFSGTLIPNVDQHLYDSYPNIPAFIQSTQNNMWIR